MLVHTRVQLLQGSPSRLHQVGYNVTYGSLSRLRPLRGILSGGWSRQKLELHLGRHSVGCLHLWSRASSLESPHTEEFRKVGVRVTEGGPNPLTGGDFSERGLEEFLLMSANITGNSEGTAQVADQTESQEGYSDVAKHVVIGDIDAGWRLDSGTSSVSSNREDPYGNTQDGDCNGSAKLFLREPTQTVLSMLDIGSSSTNSPAQDLEVCSDNFGGQNQGIRIAGYEEDLETSQIQPVAGFAKDFVVREGVREDLLHTNNSELQEQVECYVPKVGDYVVGVVVSGNHSKLDIDIGAENLGHMFVKEVIPLDKSDLNEMSWKLPDVDSFECSSRIPPCGQPLVVHDDEVLSMGVQAPLPVDLGTILTMEVLGETMSGRPLLSARSVTRKIAWQRVYQVIKVMSDDQMKEQKEPIEIRIAEWNPAGLIARIEGVRAFLPVYNLVSHPVEVSLQFLKDYVGKQLWVLISTVDEQNRNLVVSQKHAWMAENIYLGALVDGVVKDIHSYGVQVQIKDTTISGLLHISNIARTRINQVEGIFSVGEEVKVMVVTSPLRNRISFSTADLEVDDGLMLRDKQAVFKDAEKMAKAYREAHTVQENHQVEDFPDRDAKMVIANWDWLEFGGNCEPRG